jgi:glycosyltransferase involved in cell wall biosynthesis
MQHWAPVGSDTDNPSRAPAVVVLGTPDPALQGLRDQTLQPMAVFSFRDSDFSEKLASCASDLVLFLGEEDSLAPDALARSSRAMAGTAAAAVVMRAEGVGSEGTPDENFGSRPIDAAEFLLRWAGGGPFVTGQVMLRRSRVQSALRLPGVSRPAEVIAAIVARYKTFFLDDILVRCGGAVRATGFPTTLLEGALLEDFCFRLGGGRWADSRARAQVRSQLADALDQGGMGGEIISVLRDAANQLLGGEVTTVSWPHTRRSFAGIPRGTLPMPPVRVAEGWGPEVDRTIDREELMAAANARAALRDDIRPTARTVEGLRRVLAGLAAGTAMRDRPDAPAPEISGENGSECLPCVALEVPSLGAGGLENIVAILARRLSSQGFRTLVICDECGGALAEELAEEGIEVFVLGDQDRQGELAVLLSDQSVDVLSAHYSWLGVPAAVAQDIPVVMTVHNEYGWMGDAAHETVRALDPLIHGYIAVSKTVADFHAARFAIDPSRIAVVRNAAGDCSPPLGDAHREAQRAQLNLDPEACVLLVVGRIEPVKGQILLAEAVARCAEEGLFCQVLLAGQVGDPIYAARLEHRLAAFGLTKNFRLLGARSDIPDLLAAADLFVQPSLFEGLSLAAVEALQAGVPAVLAPTGDAGFLLGVSEAEPAGLVFDRPPNDPHLNPAEIRFREASAPAPADVEVLAAALQEATKKMAVLRRGAARRAEELREVLRPDRMVSEHASLLKQAVAAGTLSHLADFRRELIEEAERLKSELQLQLQLQAAQARQPPPPGILGRVQELLRRFR